VAVLGVLALALALSACAPKAELEAHWPRADRERVVPQPALAATWPLTGKPALDATSAMSPAVVLAVADEPAAASLPGLDSADVVYEVALGSNDAIAAVFHSSLPPSAGPLRDATRADTALASAYRAGVSGRVPGRQEGLVDVAALAAAATAATSTAQGGPPPMAFASQLTSTAPGPAAQIVVPLADGSTAEWHYDVASGSYQRFVDARPALAAGGKVIRATNVIVMWVPPANAWPNGAMSGSGRASVFATGGKTVGSWNAAGAPPSFADTAGVPVSLLPGNTWIEVVGTATNIVLR
jgi:hypothetical protein